MSSVFEHLPSATELGASIVVVLAAVAATVAGSMSAAKKIREAVLDYYKPASTSPVPSPPTAAQQVIGGILQEQYGSIVLAEVLRDLKEEVCNNTREQRELRHVIERAMDRFDRDGRHN